MSRRASSILAARRQRCSAYLADSQLCNFLFNLPRAVMYATHRKALVWGNTVAQFVCDLFLRTRCGSPIYLSSSSPVETKTTCSGVRRFAPYTVPRSRTTMMAHLQKIPVISIVDDDESVRTATASLVEAVGLRAFSFASGEEFLHSSRVRDTSCLISDIQMPSMSGVDLQRL